MTFKGLPLLLIAVIAILGSWYLERSSGAVDTTPAAHAQEAKSATAAAVTTQFDDHKYSNSELGVSFLLPEHWSCDIRKTAIAATKDHFQVLCADTAHDSTLAVISVPLAHVADPHDTELRHGVIGKEVSTQIDVTEFEDTRYPGTGLVTYAHGSTSDTGSFEVSADYGPGKSFATAAEAEQYLGPLAQSIALQ